MIDGKERGFAPAAARNASSIVEVLRRTLPSSGRALEVASGTGQHIVAFAGAFPAIDWQPSDPDPYARESIAAWVAHAGLGNVRPPIDLDVTSGEWERGLGSFDAALAINLIHIAPWAACIGLLRGAGALLSPGGVLYLYGPYFRGGAPTAPSNLAFDRALRAQDPGWGVRDLGEVVGEAAAAGLSLRDVVDMPANNLSVVLRRA
jgi:SAM-dependent methyltransferase